MSETINHTPFEQASPQFAIGELQLSSDLSERASQLARNTTGEGILQAVTGLHTALAPDVPHIPSEVARTVLKPQTGEIVAVLMEPEARMPFFETAANLIRTLGQSVRLGEEESYLNRSSSILALSVVLAHTFEDGNGRTARTLAHAVRYGSEINDDNMDDFDVVSRNRPDTGFKINSYVPTGDGKALSPNELLTVAASLDIPLTDQADYQRRVDRNFSMPYSRA